MRETVEAKGRRCLVEGRLMIDLVDLRQLRARCCGGGGAVYELGYGDVGREERDWFCSCPAQSRCAHLVALQLVTVRPAEPPARVSSPLPQSES